MDKIKLLTFTVISLLVLNIGTLGYLILKGANENHRPDRMHGGPKNIIMQRLQFDANQQKQYNQQIQWHRGRISKFEDQINKTKNNLYQQLQETNPNAAKTDSLIEVLAQYQKEIESTHFKHFQDIKKLCKPDQIEAYNQLTGELSRLFSKPNVPSHER